MASDVMERGELIVLAWIELSSFVFSQLCKHSYLGMQKLSPFSVLDGLVKAPKNEEINGGKVMGVKPQTQRKSNSHGPQPNLWIVFQESVHTPLIIDRFHNYLPA